MSLLFDEKLSDRLVGRLADIFPGSPHVKQLGLIHRDDQRVRDFAKLNTLMIVTKDGDFHQLSLLSGQPPKVVWLRVGNCTTSLVERMLRANAVHIDQLRVDPEAAILVVDRS